MFVYCRPSTRGQKVLSRPSAVTVGSQVPKSGSRGRGSGPKGAAMGPSGTRSSSTGSGQAKNASLQCHRVRSIIERWGRSGEMEGPGGASGRDLIAEGEAQQPGPSPSPAQQGTTLPLCAKKEGWERWGTACPAPQELGTVLTPGQTDALFDCKSKRTPQLTQAAAAMRASPSSPHQDLGDRAGPAARWPLPGRVRVRAASTGGPGFEWASPGLREKSQHMHSGSGQQPRRGSRSTTG